MSATISAAAASVDAVIDFDAAVSAERPYLLRFARQRLRDAALVEDVVHDTLLAALQSAARYEQRASLRTWLTGILLHKIADGVRRQQRDSAQLDTPTDADDEGPHADDVDAGRARHESIEWRDPARMLESRQMIEVLGLGLEGLAPLAARALTLREIEGLSTSEVARELGLPVAQCAMLLHRARVRLRRSMQRHWGMQPAAA
jgi:RNA polymerase sigma-70 factor (ECF subfamily)